MILLLRILCRKKINIVIRDIKYPGNNLGTDFKVECSFGSLSQTFSPEVTYNEAQTIQQVLWSIPPSDWPNDAILKLKVSEQDPLFDDVGTAEIPLTLPIEKTISIKINGSGRGERNKNAILDLSIIAKEEDMTRYVFKVAEDGWLLALDQHKSKIKLPYMLKVQLISTSAEREKFEIMEGPRKGQLASVRLADDGTSFLTPFAQHKPGASLIFDRLKRKLIVPEFGEIDAITEKDPIPPGIYEINVPDFPHASHPKYQHTKFFRTWFLLGRQGDRYLHAGDNSKGCVTVTDLERWDKLYEHLIQARVRDGIVGSLEVK